MPAKASIPDFKKGKQSKRFFFEKKSKKLSLNGGSSNSAASPTPPAHLHARQQMFLRPDLAPVCRRARCCQRRLAPAAPVTCGHP
jgi:hypothetical protein